MNNPRGRYVAPTVGETAFNCPHCDALARQFWNSVHMDYLGSGKKPTVLTPADAEAFKIDKYEPEAGRKLLHFVKRMATGVPFMEQEAKYIDATLQNVWVSTCSNCQRHGIWVYNNLVWPVRGDAPLPNPDMPDDIKLDYDEAGRILHVSPRGAAALLRLCIQKLCKALGEKGKDLNDDIASLVKKGLDARVQQALDVVRVVGNNSVHPGQIDLRDDKATAERLFELVNLIVDHTISRPKSLQAIFDKLPESARDQIAKRDAPKT